MLYYIADTCEYQIWKMNVSNTVKPVLEQIEDTVTNGMSDFEKRAYQLGVENALGIIKQFVDEESDENQITVLTSDDSLTYVQEISLEDILPDGECKKINESKLNACILNEIERILEED